MSFYYFCKKCFKPYQEKEVEIDKLGHKIYDVVKGYCSEFCLGKDEHEEAEKFVDQLILDMLEYPYNRYNKNKRKEGEKPMTTARTYYQFDRQEFEQEISAIAQSRGLRVRNITQAKHDELQYEITTSNPAIRMIIFSTLSPRTGEARSNGSDAIRINFFTLNNNKELCYKKFKTRMLRIETVFKNIDKAVEEAQQWAYGDEAKKWLYAIGYRNFSNWKS